jgi:ribosome-binding factor A
MEHQESTRQRKVARQLQRDLAEIILQQGMNVYHGAMITVTSVQMSPDLAIAKVWVSIYPSAKADEILDMIRKQTKMIRGMLGHRVAKQLRIVPELIFQVDPSLDSIQRIDELLKQ